MHSENDVEKLLKKDGVGDVDFGDENKTVVNVEKLMVDNRKKKSWSKRLVNTVNGSAVVISQSPGEGNRRHFHPDYNEWWYIVDGEYDFTKGDETIVISKGDFVFVEAGVWHQMRARGSKPAVRIGFSHAMATHTYGA